MSNEDQDFRVRFYERQAAAVVSRLRAMADEVERLAVPYESPGVDSPGRYLGAAEQVNHAIAWGIANTSAYRLFHAAAHADASEREGVSA